MLCMFTTAQEKVVGEFLYIYHSDKTVECISVSDIDSLKFINETVSEPQITPPSASGYEAIDLGLPSGLKWASFNVGATKPEEYGKYYAWGEVEEKDVYTWETYKWCKGSDNSMTKYCCEGDFGTVDNKTILDPEDDVAQTEWGGSWRMPTSSELWELIEHCEWVRTTLNNVYGYKVTGSNGNSIFFPSAGYRAGTELRVVGLYGYYWGATYSASYYATELGMQDNENYWLNCDMRCYGLTVRPVCE